MIIKCPIRVFVVRQETVGHDPYPVIREKLTDPLSGTDPETAIISRHRIWIWERSGNNWKRSPETVTGSRFRNAPQFYGIRLVPAVRP
jgi:hypothetical protein